MEDFNPQEELLYIKKVMEESKRSYLDNGLDSIIWGVIVIFGLVFTYVSVVIHVYLYMGIVWVILGAGGWAMSFYIHRKEAKKQRVKTVASRILSSVWIACGLALTIFLFTGMFFNVYPDVFISPLAAIILGIGYFVTGDIVSLKWMKALSIGWWGGALFTLFFPNKESILVLAGMMLFFQTIPGIIVYRKCKKEEAAVNGEL
ncbi:MAG TPA: hypothetical protein VHO28_15190 [Ignavibacteriales bacterium]|nr:hypothetical protein [Ignavibacteriales bacterium]